MGASSTDRDHLPPHQLIAQMPPRAVIDHNAAVCETLIDAIAD